MRWPNSAGADKTYAGFRSDAAGEVFLFALLALGGLNEEAKEKQFPGQRPPLAADVWDREDNMVRAANDETRTVAEH